MKFLVFITLACLLFGSQAAHWAILVAGSDGFWNYRHQSDVFHAYQVLKRNGILPENIITFAKDDIADHKSNPFPGKVFNKPSDGEGKDVYAGVKIDYKGKEVTPEIFLDVIQGNKDKVSGRVLESTKEDKVFIYFSDHGAPGLIAFPDKYLYADALIKALKNMHEKKMYEELVFYIEACESGSMFEKILPNNLNIWATTAANSVESSWATYCSPNDNINGKHIGSCLGDEYSVNFLENLDKVDPTQETLFDQFEIIKKLTKQSHVQKFGDEKIEPELISEFEGNGSSITPDPMNFDEDYTLKVRSSIDSRDVKLHYLQNQHELLNTAETSADLMEEIKSIRKFDTVFNIIRSTLNVDAHNFSNDIDFDCLRGRINMYEAVCGKFSDYGLKYVRNILQTCQQGVDDYSFEKAIVDACYINAL